MEFLVNIFGWAGTFLIIWAYYLVSNKKLEATNSKYQIINVLGAVFIGINVYYHQAWPSLALEVIWGAIAIFALFKNRTLSKRD